MDLSTASEENLSYILNEIGRKLDVVNMALLDPADYNIDKYQDLKWLYEHIKNKDSLSISETQAFIEELASIRK
ncbi:DUF1128 domain-containing protein [Amphibacillus sp. MSJ-3]|uniref:DUF1128 domain-containing protein n=1 Tax=Amphibacillus sp. MSJ-3 TaxID=2841505 RepID=UPI001C0ED7AD|nr:DUF1128 domain-containing protein [Amphibacillus sp. MSJ-3]MBU5594590.1 DUF1128 domain-containing protein [Amphibacillus sp. MSJ-3]